MNTQKPIHVLLKSAAILSLVFSSVAKAQHHSLNVPSGSDCTIREYRKQTITPNIYDALYMAWSVPSAEGIAASTWYGGVIHYPSDSRVFYSFWPTSIAYPAGTIQKFTYAGEANTNAEWHVSIGEGTVGGVTAHYPVFATNQWYRFAARYWQPADGTQHVGYQGHWMRDAVTGRWYHQCTTQYPSGAYGVDGLGGFQENFKGTGAAHRAEYRNAYYHKNGVWTAAKDFHSDGFNGNLSLIDGDTAIASQSWGSDNIATPANLRGTSGMTLTTINQPDAPTFDPIVVSSSIAKARGSQLLVQWSMPATSSPQLSYKIEVFNNSGYTGSPSVTFTENEPEARQKLLDITGVATPYVRLTISDIFYNVGTPVLITPTTPSLGAAGSVSGTVGGLNYQYYEAGSGVDWTVLPTFSALTPVQQGAVNTLDLTPRKRRNNYAFNYNGYVNVPASGLYAFTLKSSDGSKLVIDGQPVITFDGIHNSTDYGCGWVPLAAGQHTINVQYFHGAGTDPNKDDLHDGLGLYYEGPGLAKTEIPATAFTRTAAGSEPTVSITSPIANASIDNASPTFAAAVNANGAAVNNIRFYLSDFYSYFYRPNGSVDYSLGQDSTTPYTLSSMVWSAPVNQVRARLTYNTTNTIDSAPVTFATTNSSVAPWTWSPLEVHNYPSGASAQTNKVTLLGDGMNMLSRAVSGDCTVIGRLASLPANIGGPDGIAPDSKWRAGLILRGTTNATIGEPLGDGTTTRFASLFSNVGGGTYFQDDTMRDGNGDSNRSSGDLGGSNRWYKLQRVGDTFTSSVSSDGTTWSVVNTVTLTGFGTTIQAGVFIHAIQSQNPNIYVASFDGFSLTGAGVQGPTSVSATLVTNPVAKGLPATFVASVVGPVPSSYQWQFNGANIPGATASTYTIPAITAADAGNYTVVANGLTSSAAALVINPASGSGVWTNPAGGSWSTSGNWSGGAIAGTTDAFADFSTLSLTSNASVSLNGSRTIGVMAFDDLNSTNHAWTLSTGSGGPLTLATSSGIPTIGTFVPTTISAVVAGNQGFIKVGSGTLTLSAASTVTGTIQVREGTLEVTSKSGDCPYRVSSGATLKIGYSTGGNYANTNLLINGDGVAATTGFYLAGGTTYNASGGIILQNSPTTIRQYGTGLASIGMFDTNANGLWCTADASGSVIDPNVQMVSSGFGMSMDIDPGTSTATGDLTINGPLNVTNGGFHKRGPGSLLLKGAATSSNTAVRALEGTVICGVANCLGSNAAVPVSSGAKLSLNGFNQTAASLTNPAGGTVAFEGSSSMTVTSATLGGTLQMTLNKGATPSSSRLVSTNALAYAGTLSVSKIGGAALAQGDSFQLFSAPSYSGSFTTLSLPPLSLGLIWDTSTLTTTGTITVISPGSSLWNGGGADTNWSSALNWNGVAPVNNQILTFTGTTRQASVNNLLTSVGQIVFSNGGFSLSGNAVTLQWGLINQAGNNTWGMATTLLAAQSFTSNGGILTVSSTTANGGFDLTLNGAGNHTISGVISGTGALLKSGTGTAALSATNTYTGGTIISGGILNLTGGGGGNGTIRGTATVTSGGTLQLSTGDATGYNGGASVLNVINLVGGTLNVNTTSNQTLGSAVINMTGGAITGNTGGNLDFFGGGSALNSLPSSTTSTISGVPVSPLRQGSTTFNVAAGSTASGIDLAISSILKTNGDPTGAVLYKDGAGTLSLSAVNTYSRPTTINAGTLLVNGSLDSGSTVTVASGGQLGGSGTINGPTTVAAGGFLAPGSFGIGTLTLPNTLSLSGTTRMEISKSGTTLANDKVTGLATVTYGGTLEVANIGSTALTAGDSFQLFSATTRNGSFASFNLPALTAGLVWNTTALSTTGAISVAKGPQTITFGPFSAKTFGDAPVSPGATASSGLVVSYASSNPAVATISGSTVNIVGAGTATITASQAGDANYLAATDVAQTLTVAKAAQTLTFGALAAKTFGDAPYGLSGSASSGLSVTYASSNPAVATISGNTVTLVGAGSTTITASQAGNANYLAATNVGQPLTVGKAAQTLTFGALTAKTFGDASFNLGATASSGLSVTYASSNPAVATVSGTTVTLVGAGSTTITASQAGNANYLAATNVGQNLTVGKAAQTLTFGSLAAKTFGDASFSLGASASSGLSVTYASSNPAVATISGNTVTLVGAGSTTITASQAGDSNYLAATDVAQSLTVAQASQTITFAALTAKTFGDASFSLGATASSSLSVSYASSNPAVATISGNIVTLVGAGSTTITASQAGDTNYLAATDVSQTLTVGKAAQTITFGALATKTEGDAPFSLGATATSGLSVSYASSNPAVATISGNTVTLVGAGSCTITASQAGDSNYLAATDVSQTFTVANSNGIWTNPAGGTWTATGNWSGGVIANAIGNTADFSTLNLTADTTVTLDGARTIGNLLFADTTPSHNWIVNTGTAGPLTLDVNTGTPTINVSNQTATLGLVLAGTKGLNKTGSGSLVLSGANTYTGVTTVTDGKLTISNATLLNSTATGGGIVVANTGTLQLNAGAAGGSYPKCSITVNGAGTAATTGLYLNTGVTHSAQARITLQTAPTTIRTAGAGTSQISGFDVNQTMIQTAAAASGSVIASTINLGGASYGFNFNTTSGSANATGDLVVDGNFLNASFDGFGIYFYGTGSVLLNGASAAFTNNLRNKLSINTGTLIFGGALDFAGGTYGGSVVLASNGILKYDRSNATQTFSGVISGAGSLRKSNTSNLVLSATNTYTGTTTLSGGTLTVNGALAAGAVTVQSGGTLAGTGTIGGASTVQIGGTISPAAAAVGTLTINNTLSLAGTTRMDISKSGTTLTCDKVQGLSTVTYGGSLIVTKLGTTALSVGDTFQLFSATTRAGSFATLSLPTLGSGQAWNTATLGTDGSISIIGASFLPVAYDQWAQNLPAGSEAKGQDPDGDGMNNFGEFAFNSNALSANPGGRIVTKLATLDGASCLVITLPVRTGATFSGTTSLHSAPIDGIVYRIEGASDLQDWNLPLTEVTGSDASQLAGGLPALDSGWSYRSFRTNGGLTNAFLRAKALEVVSP